MCDVKFTDSKGNLRFGITQSYHEQAKELEATGKCVVSDALNAETGIIEISRLTEMPTGSCADRYGKFDHQTGISWGGNELRDYLTLEQLAHEIRDLRNPEGVHKHTLFYSPVGDGSAAYVVVNLARTKCWVEWRGFCPDNYVARPWGYGGSFAKTTVASMLHKRLFGNNDADSKLALFKEKYADYMQRFNAIPTGMEDLIN